MIKGSCCCQAVQFELANEPSFVGTCHCSRCRKVGASTIAFVRKEDLKWVTGKESVQVFQPAAPYIYERCFCKICGTSLAEILSTDDSFPIAANTIDGNPSLINKSHEFVGEKPSWYKICDDAPQNDGHPEGAGT
ncbi:GFA family protein [uncultured Sulfitobacter sp.]|uniref:GFA family protein n=1 Tax=uncultured Sulfitobacter sp. TaxID=191468 RepID=UPI0026028FDF|nr:GFA family protein [uncultured Sulfitobacter sp.]